MPQNYVPLFLFIAGVGVLIPITLLAAKLILPENPNRAKLMPYECGIDPIDSARGRYTVRYYIIAILFVVFDVETIFLFTTRIVWNTLHVSRVNPRLFGSNEESIAMAQVASVHISTGIIWSEIVIESSGGTDPITSPGHRKAEAQRIRDLIESYQAAARRA